MSATSRKKLIDRHSGEKQCKLCHRWLPVSQFLWEGQRNGFRVTYCNSCVKENMKRYSMTRMVGRLPEEFSEKDD